jgi:WD40 repeat protein
LLRGRLEAHSKDIICGDLALHLDLIATGGRDNKVKIWDYERIMSIDESNDTNSGITLAHTSEVTIVRFIKDLPLLITTDISGQLYIWLTRPHKEAGTCLLSWRNAFTLKKNCPITAIDTFYDE